MEQLAATTTFELDRRRQKKNGTFPVKLMVTHDRKFKRYKTAYSLDPESFDKILSPKPRGENKDISIKLKLLEEKARGIIKNLEVFSFETFEKNFLGKKTDRQNVFSVFDQQISQMKEEGRVSTASTYEVSRNSIKRFLRRDTLAFKEISVRFLEEYERWCLAEANTVTTIGINIRCLRRIYNVAILSGDAKRELYPFGAKANGFYQPPVQNNIKKALDLKDIRKIFTYTSDIPVELYYRDLWIFSYLCNGMNFNDIYHLKYKNIDGDSMTFVRKKTMRSRRTSEIQVYLGKEAREIIKRWGAQPREYDAYIFKGLSDGMSPAAKRAFILKEVKQCNKYMNRIAERTGIDFNITTYVARHSFATVLKDSNEPIALISEALGHSNVAVTENYLKSFQLEKRKQAAEKLTSWD